MGLEIVQVHAGRGFTVVMTQLSVEHLMLLNFEDEERFESKKQALLQLRRTENERLKAANAELNVEHKRLEILRRHLTASLNVAHPPNTRRRPTSNTSRMAARLKNRSMQVIEVSTRRLTRYEKRQQRQRQSTPARRSAPPAPVQNAQTEVSDEQQPRHSHTIKSPTSFCLRNAPKIPPMLVTGRTPIGRGGATLDSRHAELLAEVKRAASEWGSLAEYPVLDIPDFDQIKSIEGKEQGTTKGNTKQKRTRKVNTRTSRKSKQSAKKRTPLPYKSLVTGEQLRD
jgi:hypothetical protein